MIRTILIAASFLATFPAGAGDFPEDPLGWPAVSTTSKPWTRWWWLGSAVDKANLTRQLEGFAEKGIGGVEICPIYGAVGAEDRDIDFLSDKWMEMLAHVTTEAKRLGLGVDMTTGTGWPFGGPQVTPEIASASLKLTRGEAAGGARLELEFPEGKLVCLRAFPNDGSAPLDLAAEVKNQKLDWQAPDGKWQVIGLTSVSPIQKVKRAAPGGAGNVLDPFSPTAMDVYLAKFDKAFAEFAAPMPRAQFHDSFEYYAAEWTPAIFESFKDARGYDLRDQLPAFAGIGEADTISRVRADYRETLSELHLGYLKRWHDWTKARGGITRNQAHGSPGNLLDHYAISEIPETEIFRHVDEDQIPMLRIAASAAHAKGDKLVSAETFTWLDEHFQVTPEKLKEAADFVFLGGVNHVFFHGIPYSPADAKWPGWLFYASTHMGENGGLWRDLSAFTGYLQRCQSILQEGDISTDVLLYYPIHDLWHNNEEKLPLFTIHNQDKWLWPTPLYRASMDLWKNGITHGYASSDMLSRATVKDGKLILGGHAYSALVLAGVKRMPPETLAQVADLAKQGVKLVVQGGLPSEVPGFHDQEKRRAKLREIAATVKSAGDSIIPALAELGVRQERMTASNLRFVRREHADGHHYFIVNRGKDTFDGVLPLAVPFKGALLLDPWNPAENRKAVTKDGGIVLQLKAGQSIIVRTFTDREMQGTTPAEMVARPLEGTWKIEFIEGGSKLPAAAENASLGTWTTLPDAAAFSGTARYTTTFDFPAPLPDMCKLDLGKVAHTARVSLNGKPLGISWHAPHLIDLTPALQTGSNKLEIEVTNLAANRIADLDRRKVEWKKFHEINFVNIDYKLFDAAGWPAMESGLLGPVKLWIQSK